MRATCLGIALFVCAAFTAVPSSQQVFRASVQSVLIDVSVLNGRRPVSGLTVTDFVLTDNGVTQRLESLDAAAIPLDVSLVIDATWFTQGLVSAGTGPAGTRELHRNAQQIAELLGAGDRLGVITYAVDLVETRPLSPVGATPKDVDVTNPTTYEFGNPIPIAQALLTALTAPTPADRRHLLVMFSGARLQSAVSLVEHVVPVAARADALLYTVLNPPRQTLDTHQPIPFFPPDALTRQALTQAAEAGGGKAFLTGDIVGAFRDVLKEFRLRYVLRYSLKGVPAQGWHDVVVTVPSCPQCTVRARRGYMG